jgi:quercetin dioxygenase-like cupin family protein
MKDMLTVKDELHIKDRWPLHITKINPKDSLSFNPSGTAYVMLRNATFESASVTLKNKHASISTSDIFRVYCGENGSACVIEYPGLHLLESRYYVQDILDMGNLSYMDGGTNTTATNPGRLGDPVINYVYFPPNMHQTLHTHPSHRVGLILKGNGKIELDNNEFFDVKEGEVFYMRRNCLHNFITDKEPVILFVFAPDSGTGPTDEVNPLKVRTYVGQQRVIR